MPYRSELKRPDLKGNFRCSLCFKMFCHSSSLSRHRMQAHFKSYTCTLCSKEITSNETLRTHMYKQHQISRMFMCRCCNWAFPDKTSLHIHMQAMASGSPGNVSIIAKSSTSPNPPHHSPVENGDARSPSPDPHAPAGLATNGIFPNIGNKEELLQRLRERMLMNGNAAVQAHMNLAAWLSTFPKVDASGVGLLGGNLSLDNEGNESMKEDGNNNNVDDSKVAVADFEMTDVTTSESAENNDDQRSSPLSPANSPHGKSDGSPESPIKMMVTKEETMTHPTSENGNMIENGDLNKNVDLPALRSAISSSPLNSLLYRKKLNTALRGKESVFMQSLDGNANMPLPSFLRRDAPCGASNGLTSAPPASQAAAVSPSDTNSSTSASGQSSSSPVENKSHTHAVSGQSPPRQGVKSCLTCQLLKGKLALSENRSRFLEGKVCSFESKIGRLESRIATLDSATRQYENEGKSMRDQNENLQAKLLQCQEKALRFLQKGLGDHLATQTFLTEILQTTNID